MAIKIPENIGKRLPPGQSYTDKWPILHEGGPLDFDPKTWKLNVHGVVENPVTASWADFESWPKSTVKSDFHCVTRWSNFDNVWRGTRFRDLARLVRPTPKARYVRFADHQGFDTSVSFEACMDDDVILATHRNDEPLEAIHGGPMRIIIPKLYAWKSCKWVVEIEFLEKDKLGFWEVRGYHNEADPWKEERFS